MIYDSIDSLCYFVILEHHISLRLYKEEVPGVNARQAPLEHTSRYAYVIVPSIKHLKALHIILPHELKYAELAPIALHYIDFPTMNLMGRCFDYSLLWYLLFLSHN